MSTNKLETERQNLTAILRGMTCYCVLRKVPQNGDLTTASLSLEYVDTCARCQAIALAEEQERELAELDKKWHSERRAHLDYKEIADTYGQQRDDLTTQLVAEKQAREKAEAALAAAQAQMEALRQFVKERREHLWKLPDVPKEHELTAGLIYSARGAELEEVEKLLAANGNHAALEEALEKARQEALESAADEWDKRLVPVSPTAPARWLRERAKGGGE